MKKKKKQPISKFFKDNNYIIVTGAVPFELVNFIYIYFQNKRTAANYLYQNKLISPYDESWGNWNDIQMPNTYSHYADPVMETLMLKQLPIMNQVTGLELLPTYTYARIYKNGDTLHRHKDRPSCEISSTINLGGDAWPIFLEPSGEENAEGISVNLKPGDMLVYKGCELEHWREPFQGYDCGQVFCHYNDSNGDFKNKNTFDGRPMICLPTYVKNKI